MPKEITINYYNYNYTSTNKSIYNYNYTSTNKSLYTLGTNQRCSPKDECLGFEAPRGLFEIVLVLVLNSGNLGLALVLNHLSLGLALDLNPRILCISLRLEAAWKPRNKILLQSKFLF